jgi:DNA-directed RNA polymerase specialized sigma24 family protein
MSPVPPMTTMFMFNPLLDVFALKDQTAAGVVTRWPYIDSMNKDAQVSSDAVDTFMHLRPRLFGVAYRMLGSATEADDVVQDVWLRWQGVDSATVQDPQAFLVTITTRTAINVLQSARVRRESYEGPWLPEPVDTSSDPLLGAERSEALELAVLLVMER